MNINGLAICAGHGGFELGLKVSLGGSRYRAVCFVEKNARAAANLVARMEDSSLDQAPIWDDIETFDGRPWRGAVDIVTSGFPCQPWSRAGLREGTTDRRWIWGSILETLRQVEPSFFFVENVPPILDGGLEHILSGLAELGFDAEWDMFSAAGVGAGQRRNRLFLLACHRSLGSLREWRVQTQHDWTQYTEVGPAVQRPLFPPLIEDSVGWRAVVGGLPELAPLRQSGVRGVDDGYTDFVDRYWQLGEGLVPLVAATAYRSLLDRHLARRGEN